jgi:oligosaccharide repeat unit polymerase
MEHRVTLLICAIACLIGIDIMLCLRYAAWGCTLAELLPFLFFLILSEALILYSIYAFKELINPFSVYGVFIYITGFSFLIISDRQHAYSPLFNGIILLSIASFIAGGMTAHKTKKLTFRNIIPTLSPQLSFAFLLLLLLAGIGVFIMETRQLGYLPVLNLGNAALYNELNQNPVTPLHNFILLNSVLPAMFYITYKRGLIPFWVFLACSFVSAFIIVNFFSRQIIVLFFFSMLIGVSYYRKISVLKLLSIATVCVILFIILGQLRGGAAEESTLASVNDFLKQYSGIDKPSNIFETYLSLYGGLNFTTGNNIAEVAVYDNYVGYGAYALRPAVGVLPVDTEAIYPMKYSAYSLLGTYMLDPFLDFRWFGVVAFNFLYGFLSMNSFKNYLNRRSAYYIVEWSLFVFCVFMCSFTNYFNLFFVVFFFIINRLAIK